MDLYAPDIPEKIAKHPPHWPEDRFFCASKSAVERYMQRRPTDTCSEWTAVPAIARSWAAHRAARKVYCLTFSSKFPSRISAATTALLWPSFAVCAILYNFPIRLVDQRRGVPT
jgi:hypothetical protein